jgi:uncharacterized protein YkwD
MHAEVSTRPEEAMVKMPLGMRALALPAAAALSLAMCAVSFGWGVSSAQAASGPLDSQAAELVRLFNGARAANGLPALMVDPFLASKARDGTIPCPDNNAETIAGRSQDFATSGVLSHYLRLCDSPTVALSNTLFVSVMQDAWAYENVGEIDLLNLGYGNGAFLYTFKGWQTWTYATTGEGMMGWQSSSSHWNIIMGSYDRVGCGGWESATDVYFYDCAFSVGGSSPSGLQSPPTTPPFDNPLPTPAPGSTAAPTPMSTAIPKPRPAATPVTTRAPDSTSAASSSGLGGGSSSPGSSPSSAAAAVLAGQPGLTPAASPTASPTGSASPKSGVAGALGISDDITPARLAAGLPALMAQQIALGAWYGAALLFVYSLGIALLRRRRRATSLAASIL